VRLIARLLTAAIPGWKVTKSREQHDLLRDILETSIDINPLLRSMIRNQGQWDHDRREEWIRDVPREDDA
jgi:hypothetical protein